MHPNRKILLIDDDMDDAGLFKEALEDIAPSTEFRYYHDGNEAIQALSGQHIPLPDLILLDINMPALSGWDCLRSIKAHENLSAIPVLMYTTSSQKKEKEMAIMLGAIGFVTKPYEFKHLKQLISSLIKTPTEQLPQALKEINCS